MTLSPGTTLGTFEINGLLGAGGMGEVYRASDFKLGREVAIKVLPALFAQDQDRLARFEREAKVLAALNHPNIAAIYEIGSTDGKHFLVMELVEGAELTDRFAAGALSVEEAVPLFTQIAEALESAHEQGIVHRDLKPANVKVTEGGRAKVLDFGLAKAMEEGGNARSVNADTLTFAPDATAAGQVLGTPAYMAPEQARGQTVDKRADIWAFGCCLYEALTSARAFDGESVTDILARIIREEPDWTTLPENLPERLRRLLFRCLQKDRNLRLRDIGEARIALQGLRSGESTELDPAAPAGVASARRLHASRVVRMVTFLAGVLGGGALVWSLLGFPNRGSLPAPASSTTKTTPIPASQRSTPKVFTVPLPAEAPIFLPGEWQSLAISPDGRHVVYTTRGNKPQARPLAGTKLCVLDLTTNKSWTISGSEGAFNPFFSSDGKWIGYFTTGSLMKVPVDGLGDPILLVSVPPVSTGGSWGQRDQMAFAPLPNDRILTVSEAREEPRYVTELSPARGDAGHIWPDFLPQAEGLIFTISIGKDFQKAENALIAYAAPGSSDAQVIVEGSRYARHVASGHIVFTRGGSLMAQPFDPKAPQRVVPQAVVRSGVMTNDIDGVAQFAVSREGTLVYVSGGLRTDGLKYECVWVARSGQISPTTLPPGRYLDLSLSPSDNRWLASTVKERADIGIWIYDLEDPNGTGRLLTPEAGREFLPVWTPDGKHIAYAQFHNEPPDVLWRAADGSDSAESLSSFQHAEFPSSWSPDGKILAISLGKLLDSGVAADSIDRADIWLLRPGSNQTAEPWFESPFVESDPVFSPDGRWIAYVSNEEGADNIYVRPYPGPGAAVKVSPGGGSLPRWHPLFPGTRELFYRRDSDVMVVEGLGREDHPAGASHLLFEGHDRDLDSGEFHYAYDVSSDGQRFLMLRPIPDEREPVTELKVVVNWFDELQALVPVNED